MTTVPKLQADVERYKRAVFAQLAKDPDHLVALAMFNADLKRAERRLAEFMASHQQAHRIYEDGKLAA